MRFIEHKMNESVSTKYSILDDILVHKHSHTNEKETFSVGNKLLMKLDFIDCNSRNLSFHEHNSFIFIESRRQR